MKTTVEISYELLSEAKQYAAANSQTFRQLLESSLRSKLEAGKAEKPKFKMRDGSFKGEGSADGIDWPEMIRLCYEGRGE